MEDNDTRTTSVARQHLEDWDKILDEYEHGVGVPTFNKVNVEEIDGYMQMNRNQLEKLSPEDCAQIAYMLITYSVYIQKCYNRESARTKWATSKLNQYIADDVGNYNKYAPYDERKQQAIKHDEHARNLNNILTYAQTRADRLLFISAGIKNTADILLQLQRAKIGAKQNVG